MHGGVICLCGVFAGEKQERNAHNALTFYRRSASRLITAPRRGKNAVARPDLCTQASLTHSLGDIYRSKFNGDWLARVSVYYLRENFVRAGRPLSLSHPALEAP